MRPEGVARATDTELFVACLSGAILHVDLLTRAVTKVTDEPAAALSGAKWCPKQKALFVAGSLSGKAFIYHMEPAEDHSGLEDALDGAPKAAADGAARRGGTWVFGGRDGAGSAWSGGGWFGGAWGAGAKKAGTATIEQAEREEAAKSAAAAAAAAKAAAKDAARAPWVVTKRTVVGLGRLPAWYINDVALTDGAAVFTDSFAPRLWAIPRFHRGRGAPPVSQFDLGPAFSVLPGQFKANGIAALPPAAAAKSSGGDAGDAGRQRLLVANLHEGNLYRVDLPASAASGALVDAPPPLPPAPRKALFGEFPSSAGGGAASVAKIMLPAVEGKRLLLDGLWVKGPAVAPRLGEGSLTVYAADNYHNRVVELEVNPDTENAEVRCVIASKAFKVPTTLAMTAAAGGDDVLWAVNARLDTCLPFTLCPWQPFEIVGVRPKDFCGGRGDGGGDSGGSGGSGSDAGGGEDSERRRRA